MLWFDVRWAMEKPTNCGDGQKNIPVFCEPLSIGQIYSMYFPAATEEVCWTRFTNLPNAKTNIFTLAQVKNCLIWDNSRQYI
jgi:hypothetical protein